MIEDHRFQGPRPQNRFAHVGDRGARIAGDVIRFNWLSTLGGVEQLAIVYWQRGLRGARVGHKCWKWLGRGKKVPPGRAAAREC